MYRDEKGLAAGFLGGGGQENVQVSLVKAKGEAEKSLLFLSKNGEIAEAGIKTSPVSKGQCVERAGYVKKGRN